MRALKLDDLFVMQVLDGWQVERHEGTHVLTSPDGTAFAHVSTFRRKAGELEEDEALEVLSSALDQSDAAGEIRAEVLRSPDEHRALARFDGLGPEGEPLDWFVTVVLRHKNMLLCTGYADPGHPALAEVEQMFDSVEAAG